MVGVAGGVLMAWDLMVLKKEDELIGNFSIFMKFVEISSGFE